jgi:hypothetical protein
MTTADQAANAKTPLGADLDVGVDSISNQQEITFVQYVKLVLPLDNFVFWVRASLVTPSALYNSSRYNRLRYNQSPIGPINLPPKTLTVMGSLHFGTEIRQEEAETYAANHVIFTARSGVNDFQDISPNTLWIGSDPTIMGGRRFAFSSQTSRYQQAGLWHYVGFALYPDMETQVIDDLAGFNNRDLVVSNSLPAWLALNSYTPSYGFPMPAGLTLYPSYLAPENLVPPFGIVHIAPETTRGLASAPLLDANSSYSQLCAETARITLWGVRNNQALDFVACVDQYTRDTAAFGLMNIPVPRDEKRPQPEFATIAQKKTMEFEISYLQSRMNTIAQGIIKSSIVNFYPTDEAA